MPRPWARGIAVFAGIMMIVGGGYQALEGIAAIVHDKYLVVHQGYVYGLDVTAWGWIHLVIGAVLIAIGICLLYGQLWARWAGIVAAAVSAFLNFAWLPYAPVWAVLLIALDVIVIWALASYRRPAQVI
jgi:hypothetical protein